MFNQNGTFNGIDTCNAVSYGRFDFNSKLLVEAEVRSIFNRPDINAHLTKLRIENVISDYVKKGEREFVTRYSEGINYDMYTKGATYISLEDSILLQRETKNNKISALYDDGDNPQPIRMFFNKYLSKYLYPCQNMTSHGIVLS